MSSKPKVIKDYDKLDEALVQQVKLAYPKGFRKHIIKFTDPKGNKVSALPFETEDKYYLIRMTLGQAKRIIEEDDDYDIDGILKEVVKEEYMGNAEEVEFDESFDDL
jgi:hypothetical protein